MLNVKELVCLLAVAVVSMVAITSASAVTIVGDYQDDFQGTTFPANWRYQWNAPAGYDGMGTSGNGTTNAFGDPANYSDLLFGGGRWSPDGDGTNGNNQPAAFSRLDAAGGHPALGSTQAGGVGNAQDRYVIAAFTLPQGGLVSLTDTSIDRISNGGGGTQAVDLAVHVNNHALSIDQNVPGAGGAVSFDQSLGYLSAGDTIYVGLGPDGNAGSDATNFDFSIAVEAVSLTPVANYRNDFQGGSFPAGWQYLWNGPAGYDGMGMSGDGTTNPIGDPANYSDLLFGGGRWSPDGDGTNGNNQPAAFSQFNAVGGHPALGSTQAGGVGNTQDRYVIAAFTVSEDGQYAITDSFFNTLGGGGNGNSLFIHVNDNAPLFNVVYDDVTMASFDVPLGALLAGDTVYVAVGPNGAAGSDNFQWDFTISRAAAVPEPASAALLGIAGLALLRRRRARFAASR